MIIDEDVMMIDVDEDEDVMMINESSRKNNTCITSSFNNIIDQWKSVI